MKIETLAHEIAAKMHTIGHDQVDPDALREAIDIAAALSGMRGIPAHEMAAAVASELRQHFYH